MRNILMLLGLVACGGGDGEDAPSCQDSVGHFYGAGCAFFDAQGTPATELEAVQACKDLLGGLPDRCLDELEDLRFCLAGIPSPASDADCGGCSAEQDAIISCQ